MYFAEYMEPRLKDVETKLISRGYMLSKAWRVEDSTADESKRLTH